MEFYLDSDPIRLWDVILDRWNSPMKIVEGIQILKERKEWSQKKKEENYKYKRAMPILIASMSREEGGKIQHCISAKVGESL